MKSYKIISAIGQWIWQLNKLPYLYRMTVKFSDNGTVVTVDNYLQLITVMREHSYTREENNSEYMLNYAKRAVISANQDIRATNELDFFEDLVKYKHINIL